MKSRISRIWQNESYRIRSALVFGGMGTADPVVGTLMNNGGYNPEVRVRGGRAAHTWRTGRGTGLGQGGGRTRQTGTPLRVGKGHHVVPALHFQTLFLLCSRAHAPTLCLHLCFRPPCGLHSLLACSTCALCSLLLLLSVVVVASDFVVALHLHFCLTFMYSCCEW